jgi:hypothetical protein
MWWCRWWSSRVHAGLAAAGGNRVSPASHLEPEEVAAPGQHEVGAVGERCQQWHVAVAAYQDRLGTQKDGGQILRGLMGPSHGVPGRNDFSSTHSLRKSLKKLIFIDICIFIQKLARQIYGCAENSLSGRDVVLLEGGGTQPQ